MKILLSSLLLTAALIAAASPAALLKRLPAGTDLAAVIETGALLQSPLYREVAGQLPGVREYRKKFEQKYRIPLTSCVRVLLFGSADKRRSGVLAEVQNLPERELAARLLSHGAVKTTLADGRTAYRFTTGESLAADRRTILIRYLDADLILAAEEAAMREILARPAISAEALAALFPTVPDGKAASIAFRAPDRNDGKKKKKRSTSPAAFLRQVRTFRADAALTDGGGGLRADAVAGFADARTALNALMPLNGLIFMTNAALFSENQALGQEVMQNLRITPDGDTLNGTLAVSSDFRRRLLPYLAEQLGKILMAPQESPLDRPPALQP